MHTSSRRSKRDADRLRRLGQMVKQLRTNVGDTRRALAKRMQMHVSSISRIENGQTEPSVLTLEKLAAALKVQVDKLL